MDFLESLRSAMDTTDQFAYIERVKRVVHRELEGLDPTAQIADTKYFNHSAIPDFILRWPGERGERRAVGVSRRARTAAAAAAARWAAVRLSRCGAHRRALM